MADSHLRDKRKPGKSYIYPYPRSRIPRNFVEAECSQTLPSHATSIRIQVIGAGICRALFGMRLTVWHRDCAPRQARQQRMVGIGGPRIYTGPYQHLLHSYRRHQFHLFFSSQSNLFLPEMEWEAHSLRKLRSQNGIETGPALTVVQH
jgi:hypothetical protein